MKLKNKEYNDLSNNLDDKDVRVNRFACSALIQIGEPAVPALIPALNNENERVHTTVVLVLTRIGTPEAMKAVEEYKRNR